MTYLELVKKAIAYSDTSSPETFDSLQGSTDYVDTAAKFVAEAWVRIQVRRERWDWRIREFTAFTEPDKWQYAWNELFERDGNRSIPDEVGFRSWIGDSLDENEVRWMFGVPGNDYSSLVPFPFERYETFRMRRLARPNIVRAPSRWSVGPNRKIHVFPIPDDRYRLDGQYVIGVHHLRRDNDEPEGLEEEYHDCIVWYAVHLLHLFDEQYDSARMAKRQFRRLMRTMEEIRLPEPEFGGPLA